MLDDGLNEVRSNIDSEQFYHYNQDHGYMEGDNLLYDGTLYDRYKKKEGHFLDDWCPEEDDDEDIP